MLRLKNVLMFMVTVFSFLAIGSAADPLQIKLPWVTLVLPFQNVSAEYLYDVKFQSNLAGLSTPIIVGNDGKNRLTIGGAVEEGKTGLTSYIGFDTLVSDKYFTQRATVGVWVGAEFDRPGNLKEKARGGIKASMKLW